MYVYLFPYMLYTFTSHVVQSIDDKARPKDPPNLEIQGSKHFIKNKFQPNRTVSSELA